MMLNRLSGYQKMTAILHIEIFQFAGRFLGHSELALSVRACDLMALSLQEACQQGFEQKISG